MVIDDALYKTLQAGDWQERMFGTSSHRDETNTMPLHVMWLWIVACCWMQAATLTDGHEKVQPYMRLLPMVTLTLSLCFSVSVYIHST